jgi:tetratricopeptide (TPR) repeat protein
MLEEALHTAMSVVTEQRAEGDGVKLFSALQVLGDVQREAGEVAAAEASYNEALEIAGLSSVSAVEKARVRTQLATLFDFSQREALAVPLYEQAITDYEALTPPDDFSAAQLCNNLAMIYKGLGKYALAEQHYLRCLEVMELELGRDSEEVGSVYNNLGSLYYTAGFPDQAKEMFSEGLAIRQKILGPDDPDVAQSLCNIATAKHELGENTAAMLDFEQSLRILELHIKDEARSYEAVGLDYIALLENQSEDRKAAAFRKRMEKVLAAV